MSKPNFTPIEIKDFTWRRQTETIWCKPWLTAGDTVTLARGQKMSGRAGEAITVEIDLADTVERKHMNVFLMRTNADGTPYYKSLKDLQATEPADKLNKIFAAIEQATKDPDEGNESTDQSGEPLPD